jgi:GT2 family glycosyltransferase
MSYFVWYDTCGRDIDLEFVNKLRNFTDDICIVTQNKGPMTGLAFALENINSEFILILTPDTFVTQNFLERLMVPFLNPRIGLAGEPFQRLNFIDVSYTIYDAFSIPVNGPDYAMIFRTEALQDSGFIHKGLKFYGYDIPELTGRLQACGWYSALVYDLIDRKKLNKNSISKNKNLDEIIEHNQEVFLSCKGTNFKGYTWWKKQKGEIYA